MMEALCRWYNSLFSHNHPEEARLVTLHRSGRMDDFHQAYFQHEYEKGQAAVKQFSQLATGWQQGRALDFGCGGGGLTYQIAQVSREAVGIDLDPEKLRFAQQQAERLNIRNVEFVCYDGSALPFPDDSFDCIVCIDVVEHLPTPERFIAEFYRVLKPGGQLLLSFGPPWCHPHGKHMWAKLPGWWVHLLFPRSAVMKAAGYSPETTWEELGLHRLTVSKFRNVMSRASFEPLYFEERINAKVRPLKAIPGLRELFISEVIGVYRKPDSTGGKATSSPAAG